WSQPVALTRYGSRALATQPTPTATFTRRVACCLVRKPLSLARPSRSGSAPRPDLLGSSDDAERVDLSDKAPPYGAFAESSDGLEPSTPSLPWNVSGNRWQPVATVFACFCGFRYSAVCR